MITLLTLNIEHDRHVARVTRLIEMRNPDVMCLQEVALSFAEQLSHALGYHFLFSLRTYGEKDMHGGEPHTEGVALFWKRGALHLLGDGEHHYNPHHAVFPESGPNNVRRALRTVTLRHEDEVYRIGTTHFTWTPDGSASDEQRRDMAGLLRALHRYNDEYGIIFGGDFNAPRGGEIFSMLSALYTDHLPKHIKTTLDQKLHRAAPIEHAVDSILSTTHYTTNAFKVIDGVSDHVALFAEVSKVVR